jgi:EmrB/QacA subfamily drug resistance transporter
MNNKVESKNKGNKAISKPDERKYVLIVSVIASFLSAFTTSAIAIALPSIAEQFSISGIIQNWISISFLLAVAVFSVPLGKVSGKIGLKKSFSIGLIIFAISSFFASISSSAEMLIVARIIQGISSAMLSITTLAMVAEALPPNERGKGIGLNISGVYVGLTLAPVIGGILTKNFGWASLFYICIPIALIILLITHLKVSGDWKTGVKDKFDYIGTIIYALAIVLFLYGFTILNELTGQIFLIIGIILFIIFIKWELTHELPVFNVELFKNPIFASASLASLITYLASFVVTYILNYHLQYVKGFDPQSAGMILISTPILMAILSPFAGKLSDKINPQILAGIGASFITLSMFILIFLNYDTSIYIIVFAMILQGVGYGLFSSPNTNAIMGSVPRKLSSLASATVSTLRVIGQTLSLGMLTVIFAIILGSSLLSADLPGLIKSSQLAMTISTILCVIAIVLSLIGLNSKKNRN